MNGFYKLVAAKLAKSTETFIEKKAAADKRIVAIAKKHRHDYESTPERKAKHREYDHSPEGLASRSRRSKKYAMLHRDKIREKNLRYYYRHRDEINENRRKKYNADPEKFREMKREGNARAMKAYRERHKDDPEYRAKRAEESRQYRLRKKNEKLKLEQVGRDRELAADCSKCA